MAWLAATAYLWPISGARNGVRPRWWRSIASAAVENLIKESSNDIGLTAYPSWQWAMQAGHFQLSMIAYNLKVLAGTGRARVVDSGVGVDGPDLCCIWPPGSHAMVGGRGFISDPSARSWTALTRCWLGGGPSNETWMGSSPSSTLRFAHRNFATVRKPGA